MTPIKQIVEIPVELIQNLITEKTGQEILRALENLKLKTRTEYLTPLEFMEECKLSRWKFDQLRIDGQLKVLQRGRKLYVPSSEVQRYFSGEMESDNSK